MKLTNEQIQAILDGAPEGSTHVDSLGFYHNNDAISLSDLREILELRQEVERLKQERPKVIEDSLDWLSKNYPNACQPACGLLQYYANQLREQGDEK